MSQQVGFSLTPKNLDEAMKMADLMARSDMVPKDYQGKAGNVLIAVQMGAELGLKPVQALQNIAVVNGRPCLWGDGLRALVMSAPDLVDIRDTFDDQAMTATCVIVRKVNGNEVVFTSTFSQRDAETAGLWGRNTWKQYPKKMLEWRAFGSSARKAYADRLRGIQLAEEVQDYHETAPATKDMGAAEIVREFYSDDDFKANFPAWEKAVLAGRHTAETLIATVETKAPLTEDQKKSIKDVKLPTQGEAA